MTTELLPCPLCGTDAEMRDIGRGGSWHASVVCANFLCSCRVVGTGATRDLMRKNAIALWNRRSPTTPTGGPAPTLTPDDVQWVVNDNAELGVKIGGQFFFLYKGESLIYESGAHDDGTPMKWRPVGKREFGECCHPVKFYKDDAQLPKRYTDELAYTPGLSFGQPGDADWRPLPASTLTDPEGAS